MATKILKRTSQHLKGATHTGVSNYINEGSVYLDTVCHENTNANKDAERCVVKFLKIGWFPPLQMPRSGLVHCQSHTPVSVMLTNHI